MFFEPVHAELGARLTKAAAAVAAAEDAADEEARDRAAAEALAKADLFDLVVSASGKPDSRSLCLAREMLGYVSARADSIFAGRGLGVRSLLRRAGEPPRGG